ncbi:hypothetical protein, partial [Bacillus cereus group sp. BfR-BA-01408]|uniref:hypothetical protein n=1 Tax=Bacillus cereus group sp. BfR-BA-01408 TaxID=2920337 RepID=UPI001F58DD4E
LARWTRWLAKRAWILKRGYKIIFLCKVCIFSFLLGYMFFSTLLKRVLFLFSFDLINEKKYLVFLL